MNKTVCKGCFKVGYPDYCIRCRKTLFAGERVSSLLDIEPFSSGQKTAVLENINKISISGVQIKFSLAQEGRKLVLASTKATHLLKPIPFGPFQYLNEAPANEHLTMQIATQVYKLPVAANGVIYFREGEEIAYITRRFDVLPDGRKNLQEDFAQLAGRTEENAGRNYKYDSSYEEIAGLMKSSIAAYKPMAEKFFRLVLFNYMFSNGDAHLKNFSLIRTPAGDYILSPAYDLMCTAIHTPGEKDLALEGGLYDGDVSSPGYAQFGCYTRLEFQKFAELIGVIPKRASQILDAYLKPDTRVQELVSQSFLSKEIQIAYLNYYEDKVKCLNKIPRK